MKKIINALKLPIFFLLMLIAFMACDKEFSVIDSDVLGKENSNFETAALEHPILAYNKKLKELQINGLVANLLGVYNDPAFGQTTASIITQITPTTFSPNFGTNPEIDSVIVRIPYFSRTNGTDDDGNTTYTIQDSLYGSSEIKLSVYQNNYFLRDFDPNSEENSAQNYYSKADGIENLALTGNATVNFDANKGILLKEITFTPNSDPILIDTVDDEGNIDTQRLTPGIRFEFEDKEFWTSLIFEAYEADHTILSNANNFRNYFRGLYIKAEAVDGDGSMVLLNMTSQDANITIHYTNESTEGEREEATYTFNFTGNRLNTFINAYDASYLSNIENPNTTLGDEKLYLKGIEGSMAVVDLFEDEAALQDFIDAYRIPDGNGDYLRENGTGDYVLNKLINGAQLIVIEDESLETGGDVDFHEYDRIYAYDIKNNIPTIDYLIDPSENGQQAYNSRVISLGQRIEGDTGNFKYKIRLTEHIKSILQKDSTNTKIGLVLSTNVNYVDNSQILDSDDAVFGVPSAALLTPRGTVVYGTNVTEEAKKMKLEIFVTEPNN